MDRKDMSFEERMDFLAKDEQEAIEGYEEIIALTDEGHVRKQLEKILVEEKAHKAYLEKAKIDPSAVYEEPLMEEGEDDIEEGVEAEWME